uniref:DM10 domain-containing protein n=1 Tax=Fibrocapsa japonica TaxID=94617 RepID=A0A7S2V5T6_9STRA|mmetsp:Transcript_7938/g.12138  ORF Transcript_7938/g.12138 Transcript_7938/m.12138 type:complete len:496 (+) Transcript_7938:307-1794(+)
MLYYYLEDDSIQIVENKQQNSGIPQGTFVKRHQVPKDEDDFYTLDDLHVGQPISIYGRVFHLIDCDPSTKTFLETKMGRPPVVALPYPNDRYEEDRKAFMSRETGCDQSIRHNIKKNPMKVFAEAKLGNTVDNSGREGFLKYERKVLRYNCVWDDRNSLYGDLQEFKLHYFLNDDTIEVLAVYSANCGRDQFPLLLKRARLPRNPQSQGATGTTTLDANEYYHWRDLYVGCEVNVYARKLVVVDADESTRRFYQENGLHLQEALDVERQEGQSYDRQIPPYNGFGSEEDSLASCVGSLVLKPPRKTWGEDRIMRFMSELVSDKPEDQGRSFVLQFFLVDNTIMVREPPKRNSGIIGGNFLARMKFKNQDGTQVTQDQLFVGAELQLSYHKFRLVEADEATYKYMENTPDMYPESDVMTVLRLCYPALVEPASTGALSKAFAEYDSGAGTVDKNSLIRVLQTFGLDISPQALVTIMRGFGQDGTCDYERFIQDLCG